MTLTVDIPRDAHAPAAARAALHEMQHAIDPRLVGDVMLLVSELVTNSVKYGGDATIQLRVNTSDEGAVRVEVVDHGSGFVPTGRNRPVSQPGGWGLHLVDELTDRWGVDDDDATNVWFELRCAA